LIGTTDADHADPHSPPHCTPAERDYLCALASEYFRTPITPADVVWSFSGVRPLHDDGATSATAATRDYVLKIDTSAGAPVLNVFGGKITTYRRLAEAALVRIGQVLPLARGNWTADAALPGGDFPHDGVDALVAGLRAQFAFLSERWARRLVRAYGTDAAQVLQKATTVADLGADFGATLTEAELIWLKTHEFARSAEDVVWRRSKLGLRLSPAQIAAIDDWFTKSSANSINPGSIAPLLPDSSEINESR
jgi:glycerol-3-phosphate dehydrogenase